MRAGLAPQGLVKMELQNKATRINLFDFKSTQMRAFHMTWLAFFLCFFGWFGLAPMLAAIRTDLGLTTDQIVTTSMCAVASTVLMRLLIGWLCDAIGPRLAYTGLLTIGSIPIMLVGLSFDYTSFLLMRIAIGAIGASFVITQYHTSMMFAPNCVGTANAVTAGWGNSGAGAAHFLMPLFFAAAVSVAGSEALGWRVAMVVPGVVLMITGVAYYFLTQDTPDGNFKDLRAAGKMPPRKQSSGTFKEACTDSRVWSLFLIYGCCFGVELVIDSNIALYLMDYYEMTALTAGMCGGLFGAMGIFARPLGGYVADKVSVSHGLRGRVLWLFAALFVEGIALILFSQMRTPGTIIPLLVLTGMLVHMCCGATYAVVPFVNKKATGAVSGIVGAGGNALAVALMFLFKENVSGLAWPTAFLVMGAFVVTMSFSTFAVRFTPEVEMDFQVAQQEAIARRRRQQTTPMTAEAS